MLKRGFSDLLLNYFFLILQSYEAHIDLKYFEKSERNICLVFIKFQSNWYNFCPFYPARFSSDTFASQMMEIKILSYFWTSKKTVSLSENCGHFLFLCCAFAMCEQNKIKNIFEKINVKCFVVERSILVFCF